MPAPSKDHYIDTNVVIECFRVGGWKALASRHRLVTVDKVIKECAAAAGRRKDYVVVDAAAVKSQTQVHNVSPSELASLRLQLAGRVNLDPGEENLLAKAAADRGAWLICSPDGALVRACSLLNYLDRVVTLESLLAAAGFRPKTSLQRHYTERWLSDKRTQLLLESGD
jgi:hypothetical protein